MLHLNPAFRILLQDFLKCVTLIVIVKFTVKKIHISFHDSLRIAGRITKQVSSIQPSPRTNVPLSVYFSMLSFHSSSSKVVTMWPISLNLIFTSNKKLPSLAHTHTHILPGKYPLSRPSTRPKLQRRVVETNKTTTNRIHTVRESASVLFYFLDLRTTTTTMTRTSPQIVMKKGNNSVILIK